MTDKPKYTVTSISPKPLHAKPPKHVPSDAPIQSLRRAVSEGIQALPAPRVALAYRLRQYAGSMFADAGLAGEDLERAALSITKEAIKQLAK